MVRKQTKLARVLNCVKKAKAGGGFLGSALKLFKVL